ncbi:glycosyltransferase family 2 protein [Candidatus Parcubacteria bacterium]|jgi:glycosyltransferase involved in cell wall biosynthesis|nr:glycosyltransferase family 2 protein [Candidatus Parcubacteria bacterium]MBT3949114.1 glycosyltransferase family 2 protein [Candidatus Parcubacteria bacterium]
MKEKQPLFSIVVPAYNEEKFIVPCVESLKNLRSNFDIEIIVADNNSTDNTVNIVRELGVVLVQEKRQGVGAARRAGTSIAKGEFIVHVDADTRLPEGYLEKVYNRFQSNKKLVCIGGQFIFYDAPVWKRVLRFFNHWSLWLFAVSVSFGKVGPMGNNMTFKKDLYDQTDGFDKRLRYGEDMDLCRKLSVFGKIRLDMSLKCQVSVRRFVLDKRLWDYFLNFIKMSMVGKPRKNVLPHSEDI